MFFSLCNSPATFQTMMNDILCPFINRNVAICYMDDILIFTPTLEEHHRVTREILETLWSHRLFLKLEKCKFECKLVEYLGLIISWDHVAMDPVKIHGAIKWPQPTKVKEVQSFLGFVNFYQCFVKNFSDIARPLHVLTQKLKGWSWGKTKKDAFKALNYAMGTILSQLQDDSHFHPVGFMSKGFANIQWNYPIHDKEMLAIMQALEEWQHFLEGTPERFDIFTDHKNLTYFCDAQKLNRRQARWSLDLSPFHFSLIHQ